MVPKHSIEVFMKDEFWPISKFFDLNAKVEEKTAMNNITVPDMSVK